MPFFGYWVLAFVLVLAGFLGLATPLLTILFSYFLLEKLRWKRGRKMLSVLFFIIIVLAAFYAFAFFIRHALIVLPKVADTSIASITDFAQKHGVQLPFDDLPSLREEALKHVQGRVGEVGKFARIASKEFAFLLIGLVVAIAIFLNPQIDLDRGKHRIPNNYYSLACDQIATRFASFYRSFERVMAAQILISLINTSLTAVYVLIIHLPYAPLVIVLTLICGLVPIIGNLISNSTIVAISFMVSPQRALASLVFLIVLHKLEYFLNSKIVGDRIRNPVWLTLLGLIIGERLMGVPGMILAPVLLYFVKEEAKQVQGPGVVSSMESDELAPR